MVPVPVPKIRNRSGPVPVPVLIFLEPLTAGYPPEPVRLYICIYLYINKGNFIYMIIMFNRLNLILLFYLLHYA